MDTIRKIGVAGAGTMGSAIGQYFAQHGLDVILYDVSEKALKTVCQTIRQNQQVLIRQGILSEKEAAEARDRIHTATDLDAFSDVDLVIEAIIEDLAIKQAFFRRLESICRPGAILATNTSGLSVNEICADMSTRHRYLGANWWTPAYIVPLVEMIRCPETSDETVLRLRSFLESVGKKPIVLSREVNGFVGNRLQFAVMREAMSLVQSGYASMEDVDRVLQYGLGLRYAVMGPFRTADFGGVDTFYHISQNLFGDLCADTAPNGLIGELYEAGKFGVKTGEGFYAYGPGEIGARQEDRDSKLLEILKITCRDAGED